MELRGLGSRERRVGWQAIAGIALLALLIGLIVAWVFRDYWRSPQALYAEAQRARPQRAAVLYGRLAERLPQIEEYAHLWAAEATMPDLESLRTLQAVADFRPQSPAAYEAHVALARHLAALEAPSAVDEYRAALDVHDTVALRLELARYLEEQGDNESAYAEYRRILGDRPDAFDGMRRTGPDPLQVAEDLNAASYYSDALETLREVEAPEALPLRAEALAGLGRDAEAEATYRAWLEEAPEDAEAQMGLAQALVKLGRPGEALSVYQQIGVADSQLAQADLLQAEDPDAALALYRDSPYPVAWWSAAGILEAQGRLTETLPLYARVAETYTFLADDAAHRF